MRGGKTLLSSGVGSRQSTGCVFRLSLHFLCIFPVSPPLLHLRTLALVEEERAADLGLSERSVFPCYATWSLESRSLHPRRACASRLIGLIFHNILSIRYIQRVAGVRCLWEASGSICVLFVQILFRQLCWWTSPVQLLTLSGDNLIAKLIFFRLSGL